MDAIPLAIDGYLDGVPTPGDSGITARFRLIVCAVTRNPCRVQEGSTDYTYALIGIGRFCAGCVRGDLRPPDWS
ncbi:hypothetical protein [Streptomyces sp. NBC_00105]|uniref:hypothetical protein n=1 Tax=unclassified Streptomyces TaxID=2593676 RepID=UPI0028889E2D|nr:hypothetical protein [Streptomyces sp. DSM 41633]